MALRMFFGNWIVWLFHSLTNNGSLWDIAVFTANPKSGISHHDWVFTLNPWGCHQAPATLAKTHKICEPTGISGNLHVQTCGIVRGQVSSTNKSMLTIPGGRNFTNSQVSWRFWFPWASKVEKKNSILTAGRPHFLVGDRNPSDEANPDFPERKKILQQKLWF